MSKERAGEAWPLSKFLTSPTPFFNLLCDYFVRLCVRPSVMLVYIRVVSACLSVCQSVCLPACVPVCSTKHNKRRPNVYVI
jgi:hypothetical protein